MHDEPFTPPSPPSPTARTRQALSSRGFASSSTFSSSESRTVTATTSPVLNATAPPCSMEPPPTLGAAARRDTPNSGSPALSSTSQYPPEQAGDAAMMAESHGTGTHAAGTAAVAEGTRAASASWLLAVPAAAAAVRGATTDTHHRHRHQQHHDRHSRACRHDGEGAQQTHRDRLPMRVSGCSRQKARRRLPSPLSLEDLRTPAVDTSASTQTTTTTTTTTETTTRTVATLSALEPTLDSRPPLSSPHTTCTSPPHHDKSSSNDKKNTTALSPADSAQSPLMCAKGDATAQPSPPSGPNQALVAVTVTMGYSMSSHSNGISSNHSTVSPKWYQTRSGDGEATFTAFAMAEAAQAGSLSASTSLMAAAAAAAAAAACVNSPSMSVHARRSLGGAALSLAPTASVVDQQGVTMRQECTDTPHSPARYTQREHFSLLESDASPLHRRHSAVAAEGSTLTCDADAMPSSPLSDEAAAAVLGEWSGSSNSRSFWPPPPPPTQQQQQQQLSMQHHTRHREQRQQQQQQQQHCGAVEQTARSVVADAEQRRRDRRAARGAAVGASDGAVSSQMPTACGACRPSGDVGVAMTTLQSARSLLSFPTAAVARGASDTGDSTLVHVPSSPLLPHFPTPPAASAATAAAVDVAATSTAGALQPNAVSRLTTLLAQPTPFATSRTAVDESDATRSASPPPTVVSHHPPPPQQQQRRPIGNRETDGLNVAQLRAYARTERGVCGLSQPVWHPLALLSTECSQSPSRPTPAEREEEEATEMQEQEGEELLYAQALLEAARLMCR